MIRKKFDAQSTEVLNDMLRRKAKVLEDAISAHDDVISEATDGEMIFNAERPEGVYRLCAELGCDAFEGPMCEAECELRDEPGPFCLCGLSGDDN